MDDEMSEISHGDFLELRKDVQDIKSALLGGQYGQDGLVQRVKRLENEVDAHEKFKTKVVSYTAGAAAAATVIMNVVMRFI